MKLDSNVSAPTKFVEVPNAMLVTYPDAGHGSLFQFHESFVRQPSLFLDSEKF